MKSQVLMTLLALSAIATTRAGVVTAPFGNTTTEGSIGNVFPFSLGQDPGEVPGGTQRYQQVYASSEFSSLAPGGEFITQILFRPDSNGNAFSTTLPGIRIDLSTISVGADA